MAPPVLKMKFITRFPTNVEDSGFITVTKAGLTYTFGADYRVLAAESGTLDRSAFIAAIQNAADGSFANITLADILAGSQPLSDALTALGALTPAADQLPYFTGAATAGLTTLTSFGRDLIDSADASAARATLGSTSVGDALFIAVNAASGRTALGLGSMAVKNSIDLAADVTGALPVANGGTGVATTTAYAVQCGGTTATGAHQAVSGLGTSGQVLTSSGAGALPVWTTPATGATGSIIQTASNTYTTATTLTATIPYDDTIPQIGEGTEIVTCSITPTATSSRVRIRVNGWGTTATAGDIIILAVFRDAVSNALKATPSSFVNGTDAVKTLSLEHDDSPATTSAITYRVRVGGASGNITLNGITTGPARRLGGAANLQITLEEIKG